MWLKYADKALTLDKNKRFGQAVELGFYTKPIGFWITDDSGDCWRSWCVSEKFRLEYLTHKHEVTLDETSVLILRSELDLQKFNDDWTVGRCWGPPGYPNKYLDHFINWEAVAAQYDGLIITPYIWRLRLDRMFSWYYLWDCASGCIWNVDAIKSVTLIEVDNEVTKIKQEGENVGDIAEAEND